MHIRPQGADRIPVKGGRMAFEQAEHVTGHMDMTSRGPLSPEEREALLIVMHAYILGRIDRERAAAALQCSPTELPTPWRGNA